MNNVVKPNDAYIENFARQIIRNRPTVDNVKLYNHRLAAFDKIRSNFLNIPKITDINKILKNIVVQNEKK